MDSTTNTGRWAAVLGTLSAVVLVVAGGAAASAQTATSEPTVTISDTTVEPGESATVTISLSAVPQELAGYSLSVTRSGPAANVSSASYPATFELTEPPVVGADNGSVTLEAANLEGGPAENDTDVILATVTVTGVTPGTTSLMVDAVQIDGADGSRVQPATAAGTITVESDGTGDVSAGDDGSGDDTEETVTTGGSGPGFGISVGLLAALVATLSGLRHRDGST